VRSSPFRRRHRAQVEGVAEIAEPIDRAVRNARVLARRIAARPAMPSRSAGYLTWSTTWRSDRPPG
jgi:hypothetical protein